MAKQQTTPATTSKKQKLSPLEKAQDRFNKLVRDIEEAEARRQEEAAQADRYHRLYQQKVLPLLRQYAAEKLQLIYQFDAILAEHKFGKNQRRRYTQWVVETLMEISSFSEDAALMLEQRREELIGLLPRRQQEQVDRIRAGQEEKQEESPYEESESYNWWEEAEYEQSHASSRRRQQAAPVSAEKPPEVDDIGPLYKELAKKIHPDLEQDETAKARKHELMQQLTRARKEGDLFTLLQIKASLNEAPEPQSWSLEQLKRYNKLLEEKLRQIGARFSQLLMTRVQQSGVSAIFSQGAEQEVEKEVRNLKKTIRRIREDRVQIRSREHLEQLLNELDWQDF